jgi:DNA-binding LacI/PurR family transcriptional regulator
MGKTPLNQTEIAGILNISQSTVARVLNHDPNYRVAPETRSLILETARTMGYKPRRRRTGNIAFISCGEMHPGSYELFRAVASEAARVQYRVFLDQKRIMPTYKELSQTVNPLSADGVLIYGDIEEEVCVRLSKVMPTITFGALANTGSVDAVWTDEEAIMCRAVRYLTNLGHRHISMIVHSQKDQAATVRGFERGLLESGLEFSPSMIFDKELRLVSDVVAEMLCSNPRPTALVSVTSSEHPSIIYSLLSQGCRIPQDLSYFAWECPRSSSLAAFLPITGLDGYYANLSRSAVSRLLERIEDRDMPVSNLQVEVGIREGKTCTAPSG